MDHMRKAVNKVWGCVMHWDHTPATQRLVLVVLLERILPFLDKPLLLTDYLMDSLDSGTLTSFRLLHHRCSYTKEVLVLHFPMFLIFPGGAISLLALQGIFTLIQNHNLWVERLYLLIHKSCFQGWFYMFSCNVILQGVSKHIQQALLYVWTWNISHQVQGTVVLFVWYVLKLHVSFETWLIYVKEFSKLFKKCLILNIVLQASPRKYSCSICKTPSSFIVSGASRRYSHHSYVYWQSYITASWS